MPRTKYPAGTSGKKPSRTNMPGGYSLPIELWDGCYLITKTGFVVRLRSDGTRKKSGKPGYKIKSYKRKERNWIYPGIISDTLWDRDGCQMLALRLISEKEALIKIKEQKRNA